MAIILVVDDAMFMRKKCSQLLTEQGHQVVEAANGAEAIARYKEARPDGVLMDITMPDMDGLEALKVMKEYDPVPGSPCAPRWDSRALLLKH